MEKSKTDDINLLKSPHVIITEKQADTPCQSSQQLLEEPGEVTAASQETIESDCESDTDVNESYRPSRLCRAV
ncbi:hypothetical protein K1T71_001176 [Dendrolimus kikuchii]|uniref:Uncharacterized protein n=1 Tax=Dendrolimus kikuchii TaxID=765133 RepID=A0ACC1DH80_9NEOP|nr:hypothetical protein K1T71_001176 [Dendrolimus kikuchii]